MKKIIILFLLLFCVLLGRGFYFLTYSSGTSDQKMIFEIPPGMSFNQATDVLFQNNFILSVNEFKILKKITRPGSQIKVGEYEINRSQNPGQILSVLTSGNSIARVITFPEGYNMYEMAELLEHKGFAKKKDFLKLCKDKKFINKLLGRQFSSLEGYLYPETYQFTKYEKPKKIIEQMVSNFKKTYQQVKIQSDSQMNKDILPNRHDVVTLASIIEKETGAPHERSIISSVFHNRLRKKMRLQTDPTVIYGILDQTGVIIKNIRKKDLKTRNQYNTYTFKGLPKGPIANPGFEALKAALNPEDTQYLFFVSMNQGTHVFTKNYKEHSKAVRKFQLDQKARKGKSWRDLNK